MAETAVGIDIGGTKTRGIALSSDGKQLGEYTVPTAHNEKELIDSIVEVTTELTKISHGSLAAVGIGIAGLVTNDGVFVQGPHLPNVNNIDLANELGGQLNNVPIYVDSDANVAAWAEFKVGAGKRHDNLTLLTFGTGIGGGIILDGKVFRGAHGFAGEFGHHVVEEDGVPCECGRQGCWEQYASGNALGRFGREDATRDSILVQLAGGALVDIRGPHVIEGAEHGDDVAKNVVTKYTRWIAEGLANISNMLDVDIFVLGGGVADAKDTLLEPIRTAYESIAYKRDCEILIAELGSKANAIGAADLAWQEAR